MVELRDYDSGEVIIPSVTTTAAFTLRALRGLIGRTSIDPDEGLLLQDPTGCIHTFGMRCSIDIIFLSRDLRVLKVAKEVPPRRLRWSRGGVVQLELAAGRAASCGLLPGRRLRAVDLQIEQSRGRAERQSPHGDVDSSSPSHIRSRAACGDARDLPTVSPWPHRENPPDVGALPSTVVGSIQRS